MTRLTTWFMGIHLSSPFTPQRPGAQSPSAGQQA